ncbi:MAG TPA: hypothetical protein VI138_00980 [Candidatus Dormibacteraeota bacterium]
MSAGDTGSDERRTSGATLLWTAGGMLVVGALALTGLFVANGPAFRAMGGSNGVAATIHLTVVTNAGPHKDWPAFEPASFSLPVGEPVSITIRNLDSATPLPTELSSHANVTGVVGDVLRVEPLRQMERRAGAGSVRTLSTVELSQVSHTFSIPELGLNVPIPALSRTTFTVRIAKAGNYSWLCFDPCGGGADGGAAPMGIVGYMAGTVTVSA